MSESNFAFVPPTTPENMDDFDALRPTLEPDHKQYEQHPFMLFAETGPELIDNEISAEEVVFSVQALCGQHLNTQGVRNMLGWAQETITRQHYAEEWNSMTKAECIKVLFGVEIDFGETAKQERMAG